MRLLRLELKSGNKIKSNAIKYITKNIAKHINIIYKDRNTRKQF